MYSTVTVSVQYMCAQSGPRDSPQQASHFRPSLDYAEIGEFCQNFYQKWQNLGNIYIASLLWLCLLGLANLKLR